MADTEYMCVDRHGLSAEGYRKHYIGCLAPDARQRYQVVKAVGNYAVESRYYLIRHFCEMSGFGIRVGDALYEGENALRTCGSKILHRREGLKQVGRDHIDSPVGALGGQHYRYEQLVR